MRFNKTLSFLKDNQKKLFTILLGSISTIAVLALVFTQTGFLQGLFSQKNQNYSAKVMGVTESENRSSETVKDLVNGQDSNIVLTGTEQDIPNPIQAQNFQQSNALTPDDKKRVANQKPVESGEIVLKAKVGQNIDLEAVKKDLKLDDAQIQPILNTPGFYLLKSNLLKTESENAWTKASSEDKKKFTNPAISANLTPTNSEVFNNLRNSDVFESVSPNPIFTIDNAPNDTDYNLQWHLNDNNQPKADINYPETMDLGVNCSSLKIAVVDTGVSYNHPDLKDTISGLTPGFEK